MPVIHEEDADHGQDIRLENRLRLLDQKDKIKNRMELNSQGGILSAEILLNKLERSKPIKIRRALN